VVGGKGRCIYIHKELNDMAAIMDLTDVPGIDPRMEMYVAGNNTHRLIPRGGKPSWQNHVSDAA
jgi:hypothetical protein